MCTNSNSLLFILALLGAGLLRLPLADVALLLLLVVLLLLLCLDLRLSLRTTLTFPF